ncbi:immunoglobulin-like domain-containing protein, partial [Rhizobium mesoamericanum]|uniref:immunoglobulin-like domain-containing protein n=1 Tax=Rhizobium mesoamericanum TaxID=1079800 RepID=UPI0012DD08A3
ASTQQEGASANFVFTATLSSASQGITTVHTDQGDITIGNGQTTGTLTIAAGNGEDAYTDPSSLTAKIISATGGFENLVPDTTPATATVTDTIDAVTATLTAGKATYSDGVFTISYTITLSGPTGPIAPLDAEGLVFTLAHGGTITLPQGQTSVTVDLHFGADSYSGSISNSITSVTGQNEYENLLTTGSTNTTVNSPPTVVDSENWLSSDPAQYTSGAPSYPNGYPLHIEAPTDADHNNMVVKVSGTVPTGVFYNAGSGYVALTAGVTLYDLAHGINLLDSVVYRPTSSQTDAQNLTLKLDVYDGTVHVTQSVGIHEVPPTSLPSDVQQIGSGGSPLNSGNDQTQTLTLSQGTVNGILADPHGSTVVVYTDFQKSPFDTPIPAGEQNPGAFGDGSAGSAREQEVQVEIRIGANHFAVVEDDRSAGTFEQSWFYDSATGLMKATVDYDHIYLLDAAGNATSTTLASYLIDNPPAAGNTWTLVYTDNNGGNFQARTVTFDFFTHNPGDPGIPVIGNTTLADTIYGTSGEDVLTGSGGNDMLYGRQDHDILNGGIGNDILTGGADADTLTGGSGADTFVIGSGESLGTTGGNGNNGTISGYDIVTDFDTTADILNLAGTPFAAGNTSGWVDGTNSSLTISSSQISKHSITNGIITFENASNNVVTLSSASQVAAVVQYLHNNDMGNAGATVAFTATIGGTAHTFIYEQVGDTPDASKDILVDLQNVNLTSGGTSLATLIGNSHIDPIVLDLDHNGVALTSLDQGVQFDINADGHKDQIAWTTGTDGILALDVDGNGKIDNGSEIFSPHFAGGTYVDGLAALAALDSNNDGKIDATDEVFSKLTVWQDLNHNGITDSGELSSLADHSISSISLDASASNAEINGQSILAEGDYTLTYGATDHFVEVAFDTSLGGNSSNAYSLIGSDGDDVLSGSGGMFTISGGAGADTFVLDADALNDVKLADVITDFKASEGDTLDVSKLLDSLLGHQASEAEALASVKTTVSGADTVVSVNANGGWHDVAVLQNTTEAVKILFDDKHDTTTAPHVG